MTEFAMAAVFFRALGLSLTAPMFGSARVPGMVKAVFSVMAAVLLGPLVSGIHGGFEIPSGLPGLCWTLLAELAAGLILGFAAGLVLLQAQFAGQVIDLETGMGMASVVDPFSGHAIPVFGSFFGLAATMVFIAIDGHHHVLRAFLRSYGVLGPGKGLESLDGSLAAVIVRAVGTMILCGAGIALPAAGSLFLTTFALGLAARSVPQMHVFTAGLALKAVAGLGVLTWALPASMAAMESGMEYLVSLLSDVLAAFGRRGG